MKINSVIPLFHARNEVDQLYREYCFDHAFLHYYEVHNQVDTVQLPVLDGGLLLLENQY